MKPQHPLLIFIALLSFNIFACDDKKNKPDCSNSLWNPSIENSSAALERFYILEELITKYYKTGDYPQARKLANEYLNLASQYNQNWNYGNARHDANHVLGLMSYNEGNIDEARKYLLKSGKSNGSPQLDTFGPDLELANLLLKEGHQEDTKIYLTNIKKFWEIDNGVVADWIQQIDSGEIPELSKFGQYIITWKIILLIWLSILWPLIVSLGVYFKYKKKLIHWKYISVSTIAGYTVMVFVGHISNKILSAVLDGYNTASFILILIMTLQLVLPFAFVYWLSKLTFFHKRMITKNLS
ncbi:MAG: hypothetical protein L3J83_01430 [Proteobacteria bacterium]|nr:hypothetical protein [Pseudomonadota bacterium]